MAKKQKWYDKEIPGEIIFQILCFTVLFLYTVIVSNIPQFIIQIYKYPLKVDQPFSELIERNLPISTTIIAGTFVGVFGLYLLYAPIDFFTATFYGLILLFDISALSNITISSAAALQNLLIILSLLCNHHVVFYHLFTVKWFSAIFVMWISLVLACLMNLDCGGIFISVIIHQIFFIFTESTTLEKRQKKTFSNYLIKFLKLFSSICIPMVFSIAAGIYLYRNVAATPYKIDVTDFKELFNVIKSNESVSILIMTLISFVLPFVFKFRYEMLFPFAGLIIGAIITISLPIQTKGDTIPRKIHFAKLQLILATGLLTGGVQNEWYGRGFLAIYVILSFLVRIYYQKNEALNPRQPFPF
ncbi:hypothetical protein TRFO_26685 [Tritrichomonas foetus]|uniref:Uncharacterized protein n=1 Tax=Tritrichomonas foetus TaxID=1144522 RepID=A0A1J4K2C3_9EUKA|nr:hypothetical protein TRFO_26685 [Tritrichomonas foetus]|eukprot:OHT05543.1 hypothetical protein TRFO_26685 [Tritrichomonas foetus]